jgi:hypothetical protein
MKKIIILTLAISVAALSFAGSYSIRLSSDKFSVKAPSSWKLKKEKYEKNERAWFSAFPTDNSFGLQMIFKRVEYQTSIENLKKTTIGMSGRYLKKCVEDTVDAKTMEFDKGHGVYATFTEKEVDTSNPGDFMYITVGAIGLSDDIELSFIMLTHEPNSEIQKSLMKYLAEYIK